MRRYSGGQRRLNEELKELFRPVVAERMEEFIEELRSDEGFLREIRERFEQGRLRGNYPALSEELCDVPEDYQEACLSVFAMQAARSLLPTKNQPWDESPFNGSMDACREELYNGMAYAYRDELRDFAQEWLEELARVGYRGMTTVSYDDGAVRFPAKQQGDTVTAEVHYFRVTNNHDARTVLTIFKLLKKLLLAINLLLGHHYQRHHNRHSRERQEQSLHHRCLISSRSNKGIIPTGDEGRIMLYANFREPEQGKFRECRY
jgi:hypothetical protein